MSYDLFLFRPPPAGDLLTFGRAAFEDEAPADPPEPGWREQMRARAALLTAAEPALQAQAFGDGPDAGIELNTLADGTGLQILVCHGTAFLDLPYWHTGADARAAWALAWRCLRVLERESGWRTYDPQLERVLDLGTDFDAVLADYERAVLSFRDAISSLPPAAPAKRAWWKFWE